jgi:hypothetical protein
MASLDQSELIRILGKEVLPALRAVAEARREPR